MSIFAIEKCPVCGAEPDRMLPGNSGAVCLDCGADIRAASVAQSCSPKHAETSAKHGEGGDRMTDKWIEQEGAGMWIPQNEGDELIGTVTDIVEGDYGKQYVIKKDDGEEIRTPSHKVLQNRMAKVKAGNKVKIVYTGEEPPSVKGQKPTKMYKAFIAE